MNFIYQFFCFLNRSFYYTFVSHCYQQKHIKFGGLKQQSLIIVHGFAFHLNYSVARRTQACSCGLSQCLLISNRPGISNFSVKDQMVIILCFSCYIQCVLNIFYHPLQIQILSSGVIQNQTVSRIWPGGLYLAELCPILFGTSLFHGFSMVSAGSRGCSF